MEFDRQGFHRQVGLLLQRHRKRVNRTQAEIADTVGISRATYANIESGRQTVGLDVAWRLAVVLGVAVDRLCPEPLPAARQQEPPPATNSAIALMPSLDLVEDSIA